MEYVAKVILVLHVAAGFVSLTSGFIPFVTEKGGKTHRLTGKIFYYGMLTVAGSAFFLSLYHFNPFLFMVGMLTAYATYTGYRGLVWMRKRQYRGEKKDRIYWGIFLALLAGFVIMASGWLYARATDYIPVLITFAVILLAQMGNDLRIFTGKKIMQSRHPWIMYHIGRISGAYIAALTAFLVINVHTHPAFIAWLLPTAMGVPLIIYYQQKYKGKKSTEKAVKVRSS